MLWIIENARKFNVDKYRIAIVGDSAGGNMTAALSLSIRDRKGPKIVLQVLINPVTDLSGNGTIQRQGDSLDDVRWYANQYLSNPADATNPYVSPYKAQDLSYLPPVLVILAEKDELREDGQKYADRLTSAGVKTQLYTQKDVGHLGVNRARASKIALEFLDVAVDALREAFTNAKPN